MIKKTYTLSLLFYAAAQGSFYTGGGHFIKGGSQKRFIYLKTVIENFFFASAWTLPGHGVSGAIMSGYGCAQEILKK